MEPGKIETSGGLDNCPHEEWIEGGAVRTCVLCGIREFYECYVHDWEYSKGRYRRCRRCGFYDEDKV